MGAKQDANAARGLGATAKRKAAFNATIRNLARLQVAASIKTVMASPPTITTQAAAFATYTTGWPATVTSNANWDGVVQFFGGFMARATNRIRPRVATSNPATATDPLAVTGFNDVISRAGFYTDAAVMVLFVNTSSTLPFRFRINGEYASLTGTVAAQTGDSYIKLVFGSAAIRYIEIEGPNSWGLSRVLVTATDTVWSPKNAQPRILVIGDSFVVGPITSQFSSPTPLNADGWVRAFGDYLGCPDVWASGLGGTGWTVANGTAPAYKDRAYDALNLMPDGVTARSSWTPDLIVVEGSVNDLAAGATNSAVQAALVQFHAYVRARNDNVPIVYGGVPWRATGNLANTQSMEAAIQTQVAALGDSKAAFAPIATTPAWVFGTGYEGATNSSGNSDTLVGIDATHPSYAGHEYLGRRWALGVVDAIRALQAAN